MRRPLALLLLAGLTSLGLGSSCKFVAGLDVVLGGNAGSSSSSGSSSTGSTGSTSTGSSSGGCTEADASTCPDAPPGPCASLGTKTCTNGTCGVAYMAGDAPSQAYGNCQRNHCDANGAMTSVIDDADVYQSGNQCIAYACVNGALSSNTIAAGMACVFMPPAVMGACEPPMPNADLTCMQCSGTQTTCTSAGDMISPCSGATPRCWQHTCVAGNCGDCQMNGGETDVDCGGTTCVPCATGKKCVLATDCASHFCINNVCHAPSCPDGVQNGTETDADCGGPSCTPCAPGKKCALASDCQSGVCMPTDGGPNVCQAATCTDGVQNDPETGIDCGGTCPPCGDAG